MNTTSVTQRPSVPFGAVSFQHTTAEMELPQMPVQALGRVVRYAERSVANGEYVLNENVEDYVAEQMGWN